MMTRLYTFTISHFAEKARWALDYKGIHYQEKRLVPGSHIPIVKRMAPGTLYRCCGMPGALFKAPAPSSTTSKRTARASACPGGPVRATTRDRARTLARS